MQRVGKRPSDDEFDIDTAHRPSYASPEAITMHAAIALGSIGTAPRAHRERGSDHEDEHGSTASSGSDDSSSSDGIDELNVKQDNSPRAAETIVS